MADLNAFMIFARVVEAGSFSEAARRLGMPVSTVSRRVADLEEDVGARLLVRSTRSVRLTPDGSLLIERARSLVETGDAIDGLVARRRGKASQLLRIAAPTSISDTVLAPLVAAFRASVPSVGVRVSISGWAGDEISDGADLRVEIGPPRDPAPGRQRLLSYRHQLVASPDYLRAAAPPTVPRELAVHPLLTFACEDRESAWTLAEVDGPGREVLRFEPHLSIGDYAGVASIVLAGGGIGDLPPVVQPDLMREGRLVEILPRWRLPVVDLCLVHPAAPDPSPAVQAFKDFAAVTLPKLFPDLPR